MSLAERDRLSEDVVACAEQVNEENPMVLDQAEDALVVVAGALGAECDNNAL